MREDNRHFKFKYALESRNIRVFVHKRYRSEKLTSSLFTRGC